jgi:hypothetical protein
LQSGRWIYIETIGTLYKNLGAPKQYSGRIFFVFSPAISILLHSQTLFKQSKKPQSVFYSMLSIICISWLLGLSNRQFTLATSVRWKFRKLDPIPERIYVPLIVVGARWTSLCQELQSSWDFCGQQFPLCIKNSPPPKGHPASAHPSNWCVCVSILALSSVGVPTITGKITV